MKCSKCDKPVSNKVKDFSLGKFKKVLCFECQKEDKADSKPAPEPTQIPSDKDLLIIRQCIIKAVAEIMSMHPDTDWKALANEFEQWIIR